MKALFIISLILFTIYAVYVLIKGAKSISITFYLVGAMIFVPFLVGSCGVISVFNLTLLEGEGLSYTNIGAWFLSGVGFFSNIKDRKTLIIHSILALIGFVGIFIGFIFDYSLILPILAALPICGGAFYLFRNKEQRIAIVEILAIYLIFAVYYHLIF